MVYLDDYKECSGDKWEEAELYVRLYQLDIKKDDKITVVTAEYITKDETNYRIAVDACEKRYTITFHVPDGKEEIEDLR